MFIYIIIIIYINISIYNTLEPQRVRNFKISNAILPPPYIYFSRNFLFFCKNSLFLFRIKYLSVTKTQNQFCKEILFTEILLT
jgi:hypothetical protein